MLISRNKVVRFDYTLTDDNAQVLDSSEGGEPLTYLHGSGNIIPGLESALEGKRAGESLSVRVAAAEAYGERDDALVQLDPVPGDTGGAIARRSSSVTARRPPSSARPLAASTSD